MVSADTLKRTPLFDTHVALGGRMVPFAGWEMPIQYAGILEEARAVRSGCGIFDVSHMGRVRIEGPEAAVFLDSILSADIKGLRIGRARYNLICNEQGGIIDDSLVYRLGEERYLLVPNASNTTAVLDWLHRWATEGLGLRIQETTADYCMVAVQGPQAMTIMDRLCHLPASSLRPFASAETQVDGKEALISRTGYTGEDGFEVILPKANAPGLWKVLMEGGAKPAGLGARDVLRLEAGLLLHGNDMSIEINPYEAGLGRFVVADKDGYVAGDVLRRVKEEGTSNRLVGFKLMERGIPRHGYAIVDGGKSIGEVSSGGHSPTLDRGIGLGYVPPSYSSPGSRLQIDIRGKAVDAEVVTLPFYSRGKGN